jgi:hypothetical protein
MGAQILTTTLCMVITCCACLQEARHQAGNEEERLGVCLADLVPLVVVTAPAEVSCVTSIGARASSLQLAHGRHKHGAVKHNSVLSSI